MPAPDYIFESVQHSTAHGQMLMADNCQAITAWVQQPVELIGAPAR